MVSSGIAVDNFEKILQDKMYVQILQEAGIVVKL